MNEDLNLSAKGERLIQQFESCMKATKDGKYKAYRCPANVLTIGWGHTPHHGRRFDANTVWTRAQCDAAFVEDTQGFVDAVRRLVRVPLTQGQFDALVSFAYNCGEGALAKSTLLKKINRKDFRGAALEFAKWNRAGGKVLRGLTRRRAAEMELFTSDYEPEDAPPVDMPQQVDVPEPPKEPSQSKSVWTAIITALTSLFGILSQAFEETKHIITDPTVLLVLTVVIMAGGVFLVHDRVKKLNEEQV